MRSKLGQIRSDEPKFHGTIPGTSIGVLGVARLGVSSGNRGNSAVMRSPSVVVGFDDVGQVNVLRLSISECDPAYAVAGRYAWRKTQPRARGHRLQAVGGASPVTDQAY